MARSIHIHLLTAFLASLLTAALLGGIQVAQAGLQTDTAAELAAEAGEGPVPRSVYTFYQRSKFRDCTDPSTCSYPTGWTVNCNQGDFATGGSTSLRNDAASNPPKSWNNLASGYPSGTRGWATDMNTVKPGWLLKITVKCIHQV